MPRIMLKQHPAYPVRTELEVRVGDLNYGAHLGYDALLTMAHQARLRLFRHLGVSEVDLGDGKTGIVAADVAVSYQGEAFVHDRLVFELRPVEVGLGSFRLAHRVAQREDQRKVALCEIGFAAFDYERRSAARLPELFKRQLDELDRDLGETLVL